MTPYYEDDSVTLYHGDALEVLPQLDNIAATVTSPPYNTLGKNPAKPSGIHKNNRWLQKVNTLGYADDMDETAYTEWQAIIAAGIYAATKPGGSFFYNHKCRWRDSVIFHPIDIVRRFEGWNLRQELIWDRKCSITFNARMFATSDERIFWLVKPGATYTWNQQAAGYLSVWTVNPETAQPNHPCPFPEPIVTRAITATTQPGDVVFDPFAGSGTTLRVAKDLGRKAIGAEIEERYCEVIAKRLAQGALDFGGAA